MLIYILYHDVIWGCIIAALALIAAAVVFFILMSKKKKGTAENGTVEKNVIIQGIKNNAACFEALFEPVYAVAAGKNKKQTATFKSVENVVLSCEDADFVQAFLLKFGGCEHWGASKKGKAKAKKVNKVYAKKARALVKMYFRAGVIREHDIYVTADDKTAEKYDIARGAIEAGEEYEVLAPYWHLGDDVVDKGVIR